MTLRRHRAHSSICAKRDDPCGRREQFLPLCIQRDRNLEGVGGPGVEAHASAVRVCIPTVECEAASHETIGRDRGRCVVNLGGRGTSSAVRFKCDSA